VNKNAIKINLSSETMPKKLVMDAKSDEIELLKGKMAIG